MVLWKEQEGGQDSWVSQGVLHLFFALAGLFPLSVELASDRTGCLVPQPKSGLKYLKLMAASQFLLMIPMPRQFSTVILTHRYSTAVVRKGDGLNHTLNLRNT